MFEIKHYITEDGRDVFEDWRDKVKERTAKIAAYSTPKPPPIPIKTCQAFQSKVGHCFQWQQRTT